MNESREKFEENKVKIDYLIDLNFKFGSHLWGEMIKVLRRQNSTKEVRFQS